MSTAASHKIDDYEALQLALQNVLGVVVPDEQRSCLLERVEPILSRYELSSMSLLADAIQQDGKDSDELRSVMLDAISRSQTGWQLSNEMKNLFHQYIFSQLNSSARLWIVGCGQGQLAYAIAMELTAFIKSSGEQKELEIVASDISEEDMKYSLTGHYSEQQLQSLNDNNKKLYVSVEANGAGQVSDAIRGQISFRQCDLTEDFSEMGEMDLIICPEVLVYFSNGVKTSIVRRLAHSLKTGGILLTGNHQIIPAESGLERVDHPVGVFYRQKV